MKRVRGRQVAAGCFQLLLNAAVKQQRVFVSPRLPFGWIDEPPSLNRILGLIWLKRVFFPDRASGDLRAETRDFYKLFYQVELSDAQLDQLLAGSGAPH